jgi:hypothetical protein
MSSCGRQIRTAPSGYEPDMLPITLPHNVAGTYPTGLGFDFVLQDVPTTAFVSVVHFLRFR